MGIVDVVANIPHDSSAYKCQIREIGMKEISFLTLYIPDICLYLYLYIACSLQMFNQVN